MFYKAPLCCFFLIELITLTTSRLSFLDGYKYREEDY